MSTFRLTAIASLVLGGSLAASPYAPATAYAAEPRTCDGRTVTIDLHDPAAPDPNRPSSDVVLGTRAGESISTGRGDDVICAGRGRDWVRPGLGDDVVIGGSGSDGVDYSDAPVAITVDLRLTGPQPTGLGDDTVRDIENVVGAADYPNHLVGNSRDNNFYGGAAGDFVQGNGGDDALNYYGPNGTDELRGGTGDDVIYAGDGDDLLVGGPGDDYLNGGWHVDVLYGGPGNDSLDAYDSVGGPERLFGGPGNDRFSPIESDELRRGATASTSSTTATSTSRPGPGSPSTWP